MTAEEVDEFLSSKIKGLAEEVSKLPSPIDWNEIIKDQRSFLIAMPKLSLEDRENAWRISRVAILGKMIRALYEMCLVGVPNYEEAPHWRRPPDPSNGMLEEARKYVADLKQPYTGAKSFKGTCPWCKKPGALHVHDERGFYHCFGCGEKGIPRTMRAKLGQRAS